ncbi:hypothetical protein D0817_00250 [Flavobacterium cupreum]|uniref:Tetratricopeptide repeat protein n=1 Tax=Flavobacterium cupreum TaxID=2133766 RepID=A0A434ACL5_9FLAO|nr:hypothetical protein [Flavobacterium cupreum]RUT72093.1 hypothetical protein D0817_00250 [Flavobacterium cupreum]
MKGLLNAAITKVRERFSQSAKNPSVAHLEKAKMLFKSNRLQEALTHFDQAILAGFEYGVYELRGRCLQKLDYHYKAIDDFDKAIESDPLQFSMYYARAVSKKAILDFTGHLEDLHNAIYYYKKEPIEDQIMLDHFRTDVLSAQISIETLDSGGSSTAKVRSFEIKNLIKDSLHLIQKVRLKSKIVQ